MADNVFVFENRFRVKPSDKYLDAKEETVSLATRFFAFSLDTLVIFLLLFFVELFLGAAAIQMGENIFELVVLHFIFWGIPAQLITYIYYCFFYLTFGASAGKIAFGLKVVSIDTGGDLSLMQIFQREILGKFFSVLTFGLGFLLAFLSKDGRALHDFIGDSRVVRAARRSRRGL